MSGVCGDALELQQCVCVCVCEGGQSRDGERRAPASHDQSLDTLLVVGGFLYDLLLHFEFDGAGEHLRRAAAHDLAARSAAYEACLASVGVAFGGCIRCAFLGIFGSIIVSRLAHLIRTFWS